MSDFLFDRNYELTFGERGTEGKKIKNLRIDFNIRRDVSSFANKSKIRIYNLNRDSISLLAKKNIFVRLKVGYGKNIETIFKGDIEKGSLSKKRGADIITVIDAGEGAKVLKEAKIDLTVRAGKNYADISKQLIDAFLETGQIVKGELDDVLSEMKSKNVQTQTGFTITGKLRNAFENVLAKTGKKFHIINDKINIVNIDDKVADTSIDNKREAILLTPDTGLLESPIVRDDGGIEFKALLNPKIFPGSRVKILSDQIVENIYKVTIVNYSGDTRGLRWFVTGEGVRPELAKL